MARPHITRIARRNTSSGLLQRAAPSGAVLVLHLATTAPVALAQCPAQWLPFGPSVDGTVNALALWVPPGGDPLAPLVLVGGDFTHAGGAPASHIAAWDPATGQWSTFNAGVSGRVNALYAFPNGVFFAGGQFDRADGQDVHFVAEWFAQSWYPVNNGFNAYVYALAQTSFDRIVAGGDFTASGETALNKVALLNADWSPMGAGMEHAPNGVIVYCLQFLGGATVVAGGSFATAGGVDANNIATWDGSAWSGMGPGMNDIVLALTPHNGDLIAAGRFTGIDEADISRIARWNGSSWSGMGADADHPFNSIIQALAVLPDGDIIAGGAFTVAGGVGASRIARWHANTWSPLDSGADGAVTSLVVLPNGDLIVGGEFASVGGISSPFLARWGQPHPPEITQHPASAQRCRGGAESFSVGATGTPPLTYEWQIQIVSGTWQTMGNDPGPISCPGGGVGFSFASPISSPTVSIGVQGCHTVQHWPIRCVVSNACGTATSDEATFIICTADFNCNATVNSADFFDFITAFFNNAPAADFNNDGAVNSQDFFDFLAAFFAGC